MRGEKEMHKKPMMKSGNSKKTKIGGNEHEMIRNKMQTREGRE